jgi:hypothetical protein
MQDFTYNNQQYVRSRQQELIHQAEQWRLAQQVNGNGNKREPVYGPVLARAGRLLIEIGSILLRRYDRARAMQTARWQAHEPVMNLNGR